MMPKPAPVEGAENAELAWSSHRRRRVAGWLALALVLGLTGAVFGFGLDRYATLDALRENHASLMAFIGRSPVQAALAYLFLYVALTALSLPWASLLTIAGGLLFGPVLATILTLIGATAGAVIIFLIAGSALGEPLRDKARRYFSSGRIERLMAGVRANALAYMLALRLAPIFPFVAVNLGAALIGVPLRAYAIGTAIGIVPGIIVYALFGAGLGEVIARPDAGFSTSLPPSLIAAFFGMAVLAIIPVLVRRWRR